MRYAKITKNWKMLILQLEVHLPVLAIWISFTFTWAAQNFLEGGEGVP
jgi:hypothetical protein